MTAKTEACWDRTEGCCLVDAMERKMHRPRAWGDAPGLIRRSRFSNGWIVACRICPPSTTGAPRNFAWPKGGIEDAVQVLAEHNQEEHPLFDTEEVA